jgi:outer membrane lipoprotein-sorting protein
MFCKQIIRTIVVVLISLSLILLSLPAFSAEKLDAQAILKKSDRARGNTSGLEWTITLEVKGGNNPDSRELIVKAQNDNSVAIFTAPNSVKGEKMLMKKNNMWFIKPGVSKPVSISPRQRLIGGASNADIASTNYAGDYNATIIGIEAVDGVECYVFDLKGKTKKVTYDQIKYWVSKDRNVGVKAEFYSVSGKLLKTAFFKYDETVEINAEKQPFVSEMRILDAIVRNSETVMTYQNIKVAEIPASEFSLESLR